MNYPIAETFYSIQGEGTYAGYPTYFVRLAGCNVGRYPKGHAKEHIGELTNSIINPTPFQVLHDEYSTCESHNGTEFVCDTDYRVKERLSIESICERIQESGARDVSITGGEPFIHDVFPLVTHLNRWGFFVNIETSGTKHIPDEIPAYITCSPKKGYLKENTPVVSQFKFLVKGLKDEEAVVNFLHDNQVSKTSAVFLMPIDPMEGDAFTVKNNTDFLVDCIKRHPTWRITLQIHKLLSLR